MSLAHVGTKEAVAKLETLVLSEKDQDKKAMAELALEECQQIYYEPKNEKEEADFFLLGLINRRTDNFFRDLEKVSALECRVRFAEQELRVQKVLSKKFSKNDGFLKDVGILVAQDMLTMVRQDLEAVQQVIKENQNFIDTARQLIVTERYKKMPMDFMSGVHFDDEGAEDLFDDSDEDECCCEDYGYCGSCSEFEEVNDKENDIIKF